jgi:two-component system nitrate/nitrite response regulator NarL
VAEPIRLILVEDHAIVLKGLERLFAEDARFRVVAACRGGVEAVAAVRRGGADVMVLDLRMPGTNGLDVLRTLNAEKLPIRTALLTAAVSDAEATEALRLGAVGLVLKESSPAELIDCVLSVHAGDRWIDRQTLTRVAGRLGQADGSPREAAALLTPREIDIVKLVVEGHRNKAIADRLSISEGTVKVHLHNIYEKIGVDGRLELMVWVREKSFV